MPFNRTGILVTGRDDKSLIDQALDAFVYAPLGLLLEARDLIPKMADRGRGQVALTRLAGKVAQNQRQPAPAKPAEPGTADSLIADTALPIEDYDNLSSPQLLPKLASLNPSELAATLAHERSHRARATVINKIIQLQG